jgi:sulfotransferase
MVEKIFYQSSLPRAGSTMLQNIMAQNPDIYATPTSGVLELIFAARSNYTNSPEFKAQDVELMKDGFLNFCKEGMYGFYNAITDKPFVIDKSRGWSIHYDFLNLIHPEPKIICMVRDLRDVFASMEKNYRAHPEKHNEILDWSKMQGTTVPKRIDIWSSGPPVGMAIERLTEIFRTGLNSKMLFVKFEDLCLYPEMTMRKIYEYLELPFFEHDFDNIEQVTKEDDEVYGMFGDHKIRKKLEPVRSKAKELLGRDVTNWIYENYKWFFEQFKYSK